MQSTFEKYLKHSDHFADVINTHRAATAEVLAVFLTLLRDQAHVPRPVIDDALKALEESGGRPSVVDERRLLIAMLKACAAR